MTDMVLEMPPDHPWHAAFVGAVDLLHGLGDGPIHSELVTLT